MDTTPKTFPADQLVLALDRLAADAINVAPTEEAAANSRVDWAAVRAGLTERAVVKADGEQSTIRGHAVDANGSFSPDDLLAVLDDLAENTVRES
jgi:hypothetical protein